MLVDFVLDHIGVGCVVSDDIVKKKQTLGINPGEENADALPIAADNLAKNLNYQVGIFRIKWEPKLAGRTLLKVHVRHKQQTSSNTEITNFRK